MDRREPHEGGSHESADASPADHVALTYDIESAFEAAAVRTKIIHLHQRYLQARARYEELIETYKDFPDLEDWPRPQQRDLNFLQLELERLPRVAAGLLSDAYHARLPLGFPVSYIERMRGINK